MCETGWEIHANAINVESQNISKQRPNFDFSTMSLSSSYENSESDFDSEVEHV